MSGVYTPPEAGHAPPPVSPSVESDPALPADSELPPVEEESSGGQPPAPPLPSLSVIARAAAILAGVGLSVGLGIGLVLLKGPLDPFFVENVLTKRARGFLLGLSLGTALLAAGGVIGYACWRRRRPGTPGRLLHLAQHLAPLSVIGFLPALFRWKTWQGRDLTFLAIVTLAIVIFERALRVALTAGPLPVERRLFRTLRDARASITDRWPGLMRRLPLVIVCLGGLGYAVHFAYYTCAFHWGVRSSFDLGLENNLMWNLVRGEFFKSSPIFGPTGSHFGNHATLFSYVLAPIYLIAQRSETLLVIKATLLGAASVPLFLFARLHVGQWLAALIALVYLMYPPLHGANLFEFHYLPLGTFFLWLTLYALESHRNRLAVVAVILTLSVREDVAAGLSIWGAYLLLSGRRPKVGLFLAALGGVYFIVMKMMVMPHFAGHQTFTYMFQRLLPAGESSFGAVLKTVVGNPYFTTSTLLEQGKLVYLLQLLAPLAFIPLRRPLGWLFIVPGFLFTLLSTGYGPLISIYFQYTTNWTTYLFVAMVLVFAVRDGVRRQAMVGALVLGTLACSYQYGAILQKNTSYGGPIPFRFGINDDDRQRRRAVDELVPHLPPLAKVAGSGFVTPQISSRPDAYNLTISLFDAEYILFPSEKKDFIGDEQKKVTDLLTSGTFGVVKVVPPFALAKRGHATTGNADLMSRWK